MSPLDKDPARITREEDRYEIKQKAKETMQEKNLDFNFADESLSDIAGKLKIEKHLDTDGNWLMITMGDGTTEDDIIYFIDNPTGRKIATQFLVDLALETRDFKNTIHDATAKETLKTFLRSIDSTETNIDIAAVEDMDITGQSKAETKAETKDMKNEKKETAQENNQKEKANKTEAELLHERVEQALLATQDMELYLLIAQAENITATANASKQALKTGSVDPWGTEISTLQLDGRVKSFYVLAGLITKFDEFESQNKWNSDVKLKMQSEIYELAKSIGIGVDRDRDVGVKDVVYPRKRPKLTSTLIKKALFEDTKRGKTVNNIVKIYAAERSTEIDIPTALGMTQAIIRGDAPYQKDISVTKMLKEYNKSGKVIDKKYNLRYLAGSDGKQTVVREQKSPDGKIVYTNLDGTPFTRAADLQPSERDVLNDRLANTKDPEARMRGITLKLETDQQGKTYPVMSYELNDIDDILLLELYHRTKGNVEAGKEVANAQLLKSLQVELLKRVVTNPSKIDRTISTLGGEGTESKAGVLLGWEEFRNIMGELIFTPDTQKGMNLHYNHLIQKSLERGITIDEKVKIQIKSFLFNSYVNQRFVDIAQGSEDYKDRKPDNYATTRNYVAAFSEAEIIDIMGLCTNPPIDKPTDVMTALTEKGLAGEGGLLDQLTHAAYRQHPALGKAVAGFASVAKVGLQVAEIGSAVAAGWNAIKTVRHAAGGLIDVVFNDKPFDEKTFEKAINAGKGTLKRGAIHIGLDLVNDPSQQGKMIKVIKEIGGSFGIQPWKDETEAKRILGRKSIDIETDGSAFFKDLFAGISLQEIQQQGIVTYDARGKAVVDVTKLVENPNASAAGTFINANREKQQYIQIANKEFAKELELMGISKVVFDRLITQEPGLTMKELIDRRTTRTKLIEEVISDTLTKQGILTKQMQNNLYFLPAEKWLEKKRHLSFCIQQIDKLHKASCLRTYIEGTKATSGATGVGGHTGFVVPSGETDRVQQLPGEISDKNGVTAITHLKKLLTQIVEAPDDTTAKAAITKYFTTLAIVYTGNDPKSNLPLSEDKPDPMNTGKTISKNWRSDNSADRNNAVNGYFDANSEDLFPSKIPGGHRYGGIAVMPPKDTSNTTIDNTKIKDMLREDAVK